MNQLNKIKFIENILYRLIKYQHYFELCSGHKGNFWPATQNLFGESVVLFWCHIFGSDKDQTHFKNFFTDEECSVFSFKAVKKRMISTMELSEQEYEKFWKEVKDCRDKFISHKELNRLIKLPDIDLCRIQAEELRNILSEYSEMKNFEGNNTEWKLWVDYYSANPLDHNQLKIQCEREFKRSMVNSKVN